MGNYRISMVKYDIRTVLVYFRLHKPKFKLGYVEVSRFIHIDFGNGYPSSPHRGGYGSDG